MNNGPSVDVEAFYSFLGKKIDEQESQSTPEQLLVDWRASREHEETVADVSQGIADFESGKGKPVGTVFSDLRKKLGSSS